MSMWDDEAGYDRDDPKHPDFHDSVAGRADHERKAARENPAPNLPFNPDWKNRPGFVEKKEEE